MQHDYKAFLQRQVAISVGVASVFLAVIGFLRRIVYFDDTVVQAIIDPDVGFVVVVGFVFLGSTLWTGAVGRAVQVSAGYVIACVSALTAESGDLSSSVFLVAAMMLASEFEVIGKRPKLLIGLPLGLYVASFFYGVYSDTGAILASFHTLIGAGLVSYLFVAVIRTRLEQVRNREDVLETKVAQRTEGLRREVKRRAVLEENLRETATESQRLASERALLLHELHHRTKNDLQLIASMIRLHGEDDSTSSRQDLLAAAEDRIMAIALVHEYLYSSEELSAIGLADYLDGLIAHMRSAHSGTSISIEEDIATDLAVGVEPAIHLGLAVNELVQNARKHAFPDGRKGTVTIVARESGDNLTLVVSDDGIGIEDTNAALDGGSIGIDIVRGLVSQLEGEISVESGGRTIWTIVLPKESLKARSHHTHANPVSINSPANERMPGTDP